MKKLIELPYGEGDKVTIAVDIPVEDMEDEFQRVGFRDWLNAKPESVDQHYEKISDMIVKYSKPLIGTFEQLKKEKIPLKQASAEFGLGFTAKGSIYLFEASGNASIKVHLEWSME